MRVYQFIVPTHKAGTAFDTELAYNFEGYTKHAATGAWLNPRRQLVTEQVYVYTVAVYEGSGGTLRRWVLEQLKALDEQAVFFAEIGTAEIVTLRP